MARKCQQGIKKLEIYVAALVDRICANPDEYNDYVAENLPYSKREGRIRRKDLNRICPCYRTFDDPEQVVSIVKANQKMPITTFDKMTLRTYMHVWRILYEAYCTKDRFPHDEELGNEISLPYVDEDVTEEQVHQVIEVAQWEPLEKVGLDKLIPLDDEVYDFMRDEASEPLTMSGIRRKYEQKYNVYLCVHHESGKGYYYAERNAKGRYKYHYYPSFNEAMRALIISGAGLRG